MVEGIESAGLNNFSFNSAEKLNDNNDNNTSFSNMLKNNIEEVNNLQKNADNITEEFALGKIDNVHEVTIATEKARTALNLTLAVQNKVVDAYKEIMRMQV